MPLPKVLILNQPFNNDSGGGITLTNLFAGWERDKLGVACSGHLLKDNIDTTICNAYYQLGNKENKWRFPFNYLQGKYTSGLLKFNDQRIQNLTPRKSKLRIRLIRNVFYPTLEYIGLLPYVYKTTLSDNFCTWLNEFNPSVIYAQASSLDDILFCLSVHSYLNKPLIFHMMDDWPSTINKGIFKKFWQKKIDGEFRILLNRADVLMSISDFMAQEYKNRYEKEFITFHNPINIEFWKKHQRTNYELSNSPSILYAGRIGLGIDTSLELISKAIQQVNKELKISIKFVIQSQKKPLWINKYNCVEHSEFVAYNHLPQVFSSADFLILPYDFSSESIEFIKYSMPTKAPEYMVSGTPIIIFAPAVTAVVKYANKYGWAKVITKNNIGNISQEIKELIAKKELRQQIAQRAITIAEENHNLINVTDHFKKIILSLIVDTKNKKN